MTKVICMFAILLLSISISNAAPDPDLVGMWLFDEGKGTTISDSSGLGNDGETEGGPKWVAGKFGGGLEFDGVDDMVVIPDADALEFEGDFTLAAWIMTDAAGGDPPSIITKGYHDRSNTKPWYLMYYRPTGTITLYLRSLADENSVADGTTPVNDGEWHHVVCMKADDEVKVYIDGVEDASVPLLGQDTYGGNDYPLVFMRHYDRYLAGVLDEVAIFKKALTEGEIEQLMKGGVSVLAVNARGKLTAIWGQVKRGYD